MTARLPAIYHVALDTKVCAVCALRPKGDVHSIDIPQAIPAGDQFHRAVADLAVLYNREFGVTFPPINSPLLLFSYIKQLALPRKSQLLI